MRRLSVLLLTALCGAAFALPARAACPAGNPAAKLLAFDAQHDTRLRTGLSLGLRFGLDPASFPTNDIAQNARDCARGGFDTGRAHYAMFGNDVALPERWAENPGRPDDIAYLAQMPGPQAALAWLKKNPDGGGSAQFAPGDMIYVLAVTDGAERKLYAWFDVVPDDATLAKAMCGALSGQLPTLGSYNTETGESVFTSAVTPPLSQAQNCTLGK